MMILERKRDEVVMQLALGTMLVLWVIEAYLGEAASLAKPGCPDRCGNVSIPYPFGVGSSCAADESYNIACNNSFMSRKPFLTSINFEVLEISLNGTVRVNSPVITSKCPNRSEELVVNLSSSVFSFSETYNRFVAMGCENLALIRQQGAFIGGCMSFCNLLANSSFSPNSCLGNWCCQTQIPSSLKYINVYFARTSFNSVTEACKYAFIVDQDWLSRFTNPLDLMNMHTVPTVLDWGISSCHQFAGNTSISLCGSNAFCSEKGLCTCPQGYEGNPFLPDGCQDIDECASRSMNHCLMLCTNTPGSYYCSCRPGYYLSQKYDCYRRRNNDSRVWTAFIGTGAGLGLLFLGLAAWWFRKVIKRSKKNMLKQKFFKRNGGLLLQQQLSSGESNAEKTKLFTSKELEKATDRYNENRILGQGGQGTVYKGMLADGRIIAVKKSKLEDGRKLEQFINEIVILTQINHRNVVKLHGCCLETEVPLLVYEFIPNGTLYQYIHDHNEEFPLTWEIRLQVAREIAAALSYLHSAAPLPVYHRDIKSTNILLDEKYRAKVADFGTSRSLAIDQTHLTTRVNGTFGYLDPEYFQSSQFTEKSDVYSFGVVIVELLTGKKPITSTELDEVLSLATHFLMVMEEDHLFDILDTRILKEGIKEEIMEFASLAKKCLNLNGRIRPTMTEVAASLEAIIRSHSHRTKGVAEKMESWDTMSNSMRLDTDTSASL